MNIKERLNSADAHIAAWMARHGIALTRIALGLVFFWFGVLKFFPGLSEAEGLAGKTIAVLSLGYVPPSVSVPVLAAWECLIGVTLISGKFLRLGLFLLFLQLPGTFVPLVLFPAESWLHFPYAPTLEGQYIIKNCVLVCAGLVLGATMRGGKIIAQPEVAREARSEENEVYRSRSTDS